MVRSASIPRGALLHLAWQGLKKGLLCEAAPGLAAALAALSTDDVYACSWRATAVIAASRGELLEAGLQRSVNISAVVLEGRVPPWGKEEVPSSFSSDAS